MNLWRPALPLARRRLFVIALFAVGFAPEGTHLLAHGLRCNLTPSLPLGLYGTAAAPPRLERFDLVEACPPPVATPLARVRRYLEAGSECPGEVLPIAKIVVGVPGDEVLVTSQAIRVGGRRLPRTPRCERDSRGRRLFGYPRGRHLLGEGQYWLYAPNVASFDSRVFGPISRSAVFGQLTPLALLPSAPVPAGYELTLLSHRTR